MNVRVLLVTEGFPPVSHSGTLRLTAFAKYLPDYGVEPWVLTRTLQEQDHQVAATNCELALDCEVYRTPWKVPNPLWMKFLSRIPGVGGLTGTIRKTQIARQVVNAIAPQIATRKPSCILASSPPATALFIGAYLHRQFGIPWFADLRDLWTEVTHYRHYLDYLVESRIERRLLRSAARILVTANGARNHLIKKHQLREDQVVLLTNGYEAHEIPTPRPRGASPNHFTMTHAGQLSHSANNSSPPWLRKMLGFDYCRATPDYSLRSPQILLQATDTLLTRYPGLRDRVRLELIGCDDPSAKIFREFKFQENLVVRGRISPSEANQRIADSQLLLLLQYGYRIKGKDMCLAIPAKTYTYLRSGKRILAVTNASEIIELIHGAGRAVSPHDIEGIAEAMAAEVNAEHSDTEHRCADAYQEFDRRVLTGQLATILGTTTLPSG